MALIITIDPFNMGKSLFHPPCEKFITLQLVSLRSAYYVRRVTFFKTLFTTVDSAEKLILYFYILYYSLNFDGVTKRTMKKIR